MRKSRRVSGRREQRQQKDVVALSELTSAAHSALWHTTEIFTASDSHISLGVCCAAGALLGPMEEPGSASQVNPTNNALLNFRMSSDAEILLIDTD